MNRKSSRDTDEEPVIQTVAEPLQQFLQKQALPQTPPKNVSAAETSQSPQVRAFRPTNRQPLALLTILDDGSRDEGETVRLRDSKFTIGREKGDLVIPFDSDISGQHAELRCQKQKGRFRWYLIDRKSTNGTFVRAFRASLSRESELVLGGRRYLFQLPETSVEATETEALQTNAYRAPTRTMLEQFVPRLTEAGTGEKNSRSFSLGGNEIFLGGDPRCQIAIEDDPFISPKHARLYQDETERWMIEDQKSLNGIWIRVKKFPIDKQTEFQLGQQRFRFQPNVA
ncbi:FHA domain-containing protein [Stieleria varia]|uniref:FHA domain protein n=1 Tax=Stieleria varia TaxID=2528005 RepID=A0A5C6AYH1_9BACT|nr:FHA domain-containing protein [Stieleria varia]TWU05095.1 FHA domain protein [Stieleria varia]